MYIPERIGIPYRCFSWYIEKWWLDRFCEYIIVGILIAGIPVFYPTKVEEKIWMFGDRPLLKLWKLCHHMIVYTWVQCEAPKIAKLVYKPQ